jgi:hypothetical protein
MVDVVRDQTERGVHLYLCLPVVANLRSLWKTLDNILWSKLSVRRVLQSQSNMRKHQANFLGLENSSTTCILRPVGLNAVCKLVIVQILC